MALMQSTTYETFKRHEHETKTNNKPVVPNADDIEHTIVIGNTGLGKSSLIKLLTKNSGIKTADNEDACTTETQPYPLTITDKDNNEIIHSLIYDTQGTQDTKSIDKDDDDMVWPKILGVKKIVKF